MSLNEMVSAQCSVISMQSEIIKDLFNLLSQHITVEEAENLSQRISAVENMRQGID